MPHVPRVPPPLQAVLLEMSHPQPGLAQLAALLKWTRLSISVVLANPAAAKIAVFLFVVGTCWNWALEQACVASFALCLVPVSC